MSNFRRPPEDVEKMTSLRVGNIPFKTHQEDLKEVFEKYGKVGDVFIPADRETGRTRGFAFVRFYDKKDAEVKASIFTRHSAIIQLVTESFH